MADSSWWSKLWALWGEASEIERARLEFAPLVRKYKPLANRIVDIIFGTDNGVPTHPDAKKQVIEAMRDHLSPEDLAVLNRDESRGG